MSRAGWHGWSDERGDPTIETVAKCVDCCWSIEVDNRDKSVIRLVLHHCRKFNHRVESVTTRTVLYTPQ